MKCLRVYVDTSVLGGCLDAEFRQPSRRLIAMARTGEAILLISDLLLVELRNAPDPVRRILTTLPVTVVENVPLSEEATALRNAYLNDKVVGQAHSNDALHVALATVARADVIASWNFKHIVHFDKIRKFNSVNLREGYVPLEIRSPVEVA